MNFVGGIRLDKTMAIPKIELVRASADSKKLWTNQKQDEVISHTASPLVVYGGPGTGKSATLVRSSLTLHQLRHTSKVRVLM